MRKTRLVTDADEQLKWLDELSAARVRAYALADVLRVIDLDYNEVGTETLPQVAMAIQEELETIEKRAGALWEAKKSRQDGLGSPISAEAKG
jgi:hypothetical protein